MDLELIKINQNEFQIIIEESPKYCTDLLWTQAVILHSIVIIYLQKSDSDLSCLDSWLLLGQLKREKSLIQWQFLKDKLVVVFVDMLLLCLRCEWGDTCGGTVEMFLYWMWFHLSWLCWYGAGTIIVV